MTLVDDIGGLGITTGTSALIGFVTAWGRLQQVDPCSLHSGIWNRRYRKSADGGWSDSSTFF